MPAGVFNHHVERDPGGSLSVSIIGVRFMIWLLIVAIVSFGAGAYCHEKYWPRLQEVLKQML